MKKQIVIMHGGHALDSREDFLERLTTKEVTAESFKSKEDWKPVVERALGSEFEIFLPKMPNKEWAQYPEWKIWFERLIPFLHDDVIFIGHSLGALFFIKFLSENTFPKHIAKLILVAAPYTGKDQKHSLNTNFKLGENLSGVAAQISHICFYHSPDDPVVPYSDFELYKKAIPSARFIPLERRGHFNGSEFPEIIETIRAAV